ncbi:MAG: DnaJ domain-containing protein [bacterium]
MQNLYELLGVTEEATSDDIRKAYRSLAKQYHPDSGNGDEEAFRKANQAYNVLSKPESRHDYDKTLRNFRNQTGSVDGYTADRYEVTGDQIQKMIEEMVRQTNLTRVQIKYKGRVIADMPITTATAITTLGLIFAPIPTILLNMGINRFFEMDLKNLVMERYEEAVKIHESGRLAEAEKKYRELIEMSEYFVPAHLNLGMLYRQLGENRKAEDCFKKVLDVAPFGEVGAVARTNLESIRGF